MELRMCQEGHSRLVLACFGEIGWDSADQLVKKVTGEVEGHASPQVIVDLEGVDCITSAGIGGLLQLRRYVLDRHGCLVMARPGPLIAHLFRTIGLDRHLPLFDTLDDARRILDQAAAKQATARATTA